MFTIEQGPSRLIANNLPRLLESIIKGCLDPSIPYDFREKILPTVTAILQELIRSHRTVSFHTQTQRLAVGTESTGESLSSKASLGPGQIIVWDLKTATRIQVIEAHCPHAITALSFNRNSVTANGNALLVSYSASENAVKFWQQPSGLLGALTSSLGRIGGERNQSNIFANLVTGGLFQVFRTFAVDGFDDASRNHSRFEWTSERSVRLLRELKSDLTFSV